MPLAMARARGNRRPMPGLHVVPCQHDHHSRPSADQRGAATTVPRPPRRRVPASRGRRADAAAHLLPRTGGRSCPRRVAGGQRHDLPVPLRPRRVAGGQRHDREAVPLRRGIHDDPAPLRDIRNAALAYRLAGYAPRWSTVLGPKLRRVPCVYWAIHWKTERIRDRLAGGSVT